MKDLLVVLLLASCIIHLNEGYYFKGKRSLMKELKKDITSNVAVPEDRGRRDFKGAKRDPSNEDICRLAKEIC